MIIYRTMHFEVKEDYERNNKVVDWFQLSYTFLIYC